MDRMLSTKAGQYLAYAMESWSPICKHLPFVKGAGDDDVVRPIYKTAIVIPITQSAFGVLS